MHQVSKRFARSALINELTVTPIIENAETDAACIRIGKMQFSFQISPI